MIFSNNSEYDDNEATPLEGAFYATSGYEKLFFSHFREEDETIFSRISALDSETEDFILCDNNLVSLKNTLEYKTNLLPLTPTNRIITSLFSRNRLMLILKYAFAYVEWTDDNGICHLEKHVMRYPQFFATLAIEKKLRSGVKKELFGIHKEAVKQLLHISTSTIYEIFFRSNVLLQNSISLWIV
jgi:type I restriction enzyme R subunit